MELDTHPGYARLAEQLAVLRSMLELLKQLHPDDTNLRLALIALWGPVLKSVATDDALWAFAYYEFDALCREAGLRDPRSVGLPLVRLTPCSRGRCAPPAKARAEAEAA